MGLLGIDVGTTGCKSAVFSDNGKILALAYEEYNHNSPKTGWAELNSIEVLEKTKKTIAKVVREANPDSIEGISVASLGEAVVPVTKDRKVLGSSILNFDRRGEEYLKELEGSLPNEKLYSINGNTLGNNFTLSKLKWIKENQPELYQKADLFLPWTSFISFMLGAEPVVDYSLANRTLLFDIDQENWSEEIIRISDLDIEKLPAVKRAGTIIGAVSNQAAKEYGLKPDTPIVIGAHDQCANAVGCGVIEEGEAMLGMGTFTTATPVYKKRRDSNLMVPKGVNTENHAIPNHFVSLIYNHGGSVVKWFRNTFAEHEHQLAVQKGVDVYEILFSEVSEGPSKQVILPYLSTTGLPDFNPNTSGVITGLRLDTCRGEILKGIIQGIIFDLKMTIDFLEETGISINNFRAVGGGSKSDSWVQMCADILKCPMVVPRITESGVLGSAIIAGVGIGKIPDFITGVKAMVQLEKTFEPNLEHYKEYQSYYERFVQLRQLTDSYLKELSRIKKY
jgi:xylulokinase